MGATLKNGSIAGVLLFFLAIASTFPYFDAGLGNTAIAFWTIGFAALSGIIYLETGRRTGRETSGVVSAGLAGVVAGGIAAFSGPLTHAILSVTPAYARYLHHALGKSAHLYGQGGFAIVMAGLFGAIVMSSLYGGVLALCGGVFGMVGRRRRVSPEGS